MPFRQRGNQRSGEDNVAEEGSLYNQGGRMGGRTVSKLWPARLLVRFSA
jgi:hypothetical protein